MEMCYTLGLPLTAMCGWVGIIRLTHTCRYTTLWRDGGREEGVGGGLRDL